MDSNNLDELTQMLLKKCEVSNLNQFYHKWADDNNGSIPIKHICALHKNFNESKVISDIDDIEDLIIINIPDYTQKNDLTRERFLIDSLGLGKIINSLKRLNIIKKSTNVDDVLSKLGLEETQLKKMINLLKKSISDTVIYANLHNDEKEIVFYSKIKHPQHRGDFIKLIMTIIAAIALLSTLIPVMIFINSQG